MTSGHQAEVMLEIAAAPAVVFGYLTDAERYVRWMGASATLEPGPGGRYQVAMRDGFRAAGGQCPAGGQLPGHGDADPGG